MADAFLSIFRGILFLDYKKENEYVDYQQRNFMLQGTGFP